MHKEEVMAEEIAMETEMAKVAVMMIKNGTTMGITIHKAIIAIVTMIIGIMEEGTTIIGTITTGEVMTDIDTTATVLIILIIALHIGLHLITTIKDHDMCSIATTMFTTIVSVACI
jgi:hypothetical protein